MIGLLQSAETVTHRHDPMRPVPYRIIKRQRDTADTFTLDLVPYGSSALRPFAPGQFNMLYVYGVGEIPISVSGDPSMPSPIVHTTRAVGNVTKAMSRLNAGDIVGLRGPFGTAWPVGPAEGKDVIIITGGIGLAPLRPAIYHLLSQRGAYGKIVILYGARTPGDILYKDELAQWKARLDLDVHVTVDNATDRWHGNVGFVTTLVQRAPFNPRNVVALICGPEVMMRYTIQALNQRGMADDAIYVSMERNMQCAIGLCGHCQFGAHFVCRDGPVFRYDGIRPIFLEWEV
jgi:NAD(P)H-flavin reductase